MKLFADDRETEWKKNMIVNELWRTIQMLKNTLKDILFYY